MLWNYSGYILRDGVGTAMVLSCPYGDGVWAQGRMHQELCPSHKPSAAQPCLEFCSAAEAAAAGFGEKREFPAWCRGLQSIPTLH